MFFIELRHAEERHNEDNDEDYQERKLRVEVNNSEVREVGCDPVQESRKHGWRADQFCELIVSTFAARLDGRMVFRAVRLQLWVVRGPVAERLRSKGGVCRRNDHCEAVIQREDHEREEHCCHEHCIGSGVALSDAEKNDPEEADSDGSQANNAGTEEEQREEQEDDVVDRKHTGGVGQQGIDGLENLGLAEQVAARGSADRVLDLVDHRDQHACKDDQRDDQQQYSKDELQRSKDGLKLDPRPHEEVASFS